MLVGEDGRIVKVCSAAEMDEFVPSSRPGWATADSTHKVDATGKVVVPGTTRAPTMNTVYGAPRRGDVG